MTSGPLSQNTVPVSRSLERWILILAVVFISLAAFQTMAATTAMPYIVEILGGKRLYALAAGIVFAAQLMTTALAGPWVDARGPKPSFFTGATLAMLGLTIAALAPNIEFIVLGRALQGLGSGLLVVPLYVLVGNFISKERQPRYFAAFATAWVIPSLVGPFLAGLLVEYASWRWVFGFTPIVFILIVPLAWTQFKQLPAHQNLQPLRALNVFYLACGASIGIAALLVASSNKGQPDLKTIALLGIGMILVCAFAPLLLPEGTFKARRGMPSTVLLRGVANGSLMAVEIYLPLILKEIHGWSATRAGFVLTMSAISWALASQLQGRIVDERKRAHIPYLGIGLQLVGTLVVLPSVHPSVSGLVVLFGWFIAGFGLGYLYPALTVHALALTPLQRHGEVSAALQIADTLGAAFLIGIVGIAYAISSGLGHAAFAVPILIIIVILIGAVMLTNRLQPQDV
ncbi:MFS transporter [Arcanobacterium phocisimile]|uniref:MFS transporter n=1 Tax=Arcanobacterium phocisimile TaxID=1302235 RepID=A0ABX7IIY8_9ACTO|nr:MFS transporter [Arcanobacterium phocisimile]QRV02927.1 MFS transporter [Arcanobacterium phocisimile]